MSYKEIIQHCKALGNGETQPDCEVVGLCRELTKLFGIDIWEIVDFSLYPNFSGDSAYPIPSFRPDMTPEEIYDLCHNLWEGEYGNERRRFCLWVAYKLEELDNEQ